MNDSFIPVVGSRYHLNGVLFEVTRVENDYVRLRGVDVKRDRTMALVDVASLIKSGTLKLQMRAPIEITNAPVLLSLDDKQRKAYERKLAYVQAAFREFNAALPVNATPQLILDVAQRIGDPNPPAYITLYRWYKRFKHGNGNPLSLIEAKVQRTRLTPKKNEEVVLLMKQYISEEYLKNTRPSALVVYHLLVAQLVADNYHREPHQQLIPPSRATFYRQIDKLDPYIADLARYGKQVARKRNRYGRKIYSPMRIGERVEVDCNLMDIQVIDDDGEVIGRPWLCAMIDVHTRCIVGWEISFMPPCGAKVMRALRHAMSDDSPRIYGCAPEELVLDNGPEFLNTVLQTVAGSYGIILRYAAPRSPNEKPHIERFFKTLNSQLVHLMSGTTRSNPADKGDYQSHEEAVYLLEQVQAKFQFWVDEIYHRTPHDALSIPPAVMWKRAAAEDMPPQRYPAADLSITCRSVVSRAISGGRLSISNLGWTGPGLPDIAARLSRLPSGNKTKVYYDESDLSYVWVADPDDRTRLIRAEAIDPTYQNGLSMYEHSLIQGVLRSEGKAISSHELHAARLTLYQQLSTDTKTARKKTGAYE